MLDTVHDEYGQNDQSALLFSLDDFHLYEATAYLMASSKNAQRLNQAIAEIEANKIVFENCVVN